MSAKDALLLAGRAVTLALHPTVKGFNDTWVDVVSRDFQALSDADKENVVVMLASLAARVLSTDPDPEDYLEQILLGARQRLGVDA